MQSLHNTGLGEKTVYPEKYDASLLFPIPRQLGRDSLGLKAVLPFTGFDIWNAFEMSWLNTRGKPVVAACEIIVPHSSPFLIESKSLKLYFNSINNTSFASFAEVEALLTQDLSKALGAAIKVKLTPLNAVSERLCKNFSGICLDELDVHCHHYQPHAEYLLTYDEFVTESLYSNLLKSNCPVTSQPDWASVQVNYTGKKIDHDGLLKYLISYRHHEGFHEQIVEQIFVELMKQCAPEKLFVYARFTRRGGLDINPYRANYAVELDNTRLWRQ